MPFADVNDIRMYYEEEGQGQPLLLLHSGTGAIDAMSGWPKMRAVFSARYRCFFVEHRGHCRTNNPSGSMSYALIADDMAKFIEQLDVAPAHLAGVSDGATVGPALGMTRPDLLRSLVCIGANIYIDDHLRHAMEFFDADIIERDHPEYARIFADSHDPHHYPGYWRELVRQVRENGETELA